MSLDFDALRKASLARSAKWHRGDQPDLVWWSNAVAGEAGEVCNVTKKLDRDAKGLVGNKKGGDELLEDLALEIADTVIYLDLLAAAAGIDLGRAVVAKFNLVSAENGFPERLTMDGEAARARGIDLGAGNIGRGARGASGAGPKPGGEPILEAMGDKPSVDAVGGPRLEADGEKR